MDGRNQDISRAVRDRIVQFGLMTFLALAALGSTSGIVSASAIRSEGIVVNNIDSLGPQWAAFLSYGSTFWATHASPPFPTGLILPKVDGVLVETPFVEYLDWRRDIAPARFDHYHPIVGPELAQLPAPQTITPPVTTPTPPIPGGSTGGGGGPLPQVPEPGSFLIALTLLGASLGWGYHARSSSNTRPPSRP